MRPVALMPAPATTIRDRIRAIQAEVGQADLLPDRGAELLMQSTALIGNVLDEIRQADLIYNNVLLACFETETKANRAKIVAETTPAYQRKREARDTKELLTELIAGLKYFLRMKTEEMRLSR